jgi:formamidopyrimidine-DNA glycosylase
MMWGSWQIGSPPLKLRKDPRYVRVRLLTATHEAVFFHGPIVELLTREELARHRTLPHLGPDLLWDGYDRDQAARRVLAEGDRPIGDVLLDQRVVAGIGNIYKSEGLLLAGVDPRRPAASLSRGEVERIWDVLVPMMRAAAEPGGRMIQMPPELSAQGFRRWAYRRRNQPCLRCGAPIEMVRQGGLQRSSYFCPVCQPLNPAPTPMPAAQPAPAAAAT